MTQLSSSHLPWAASQARKSQRFLRSPGPEAFSSFQAGHSPARRSSLASSFQAGAGGLGSGLSCAGPGCSPSAWGDAWGTWDITALLPQPWPLLHGSAGPPTASPAEQGPHRIPWARCLLLPLGRQTTGIEGWFEVPGKSPPSSSQ